MKYLTKLALLSNSSLQALVLAKQLLSLLNRERICLNRPGLSEQTKRVWSWSIRLIMSVTSLTTLMALSSHSTLSLNLWTVRSLLQTAKNLKRAREMKFMRELSEKADKHINNRLTTTLNKGKLLSNH